MGQDREIGSGGGGGAVSEQPENAWDYEEALAADRRFERRLPVKELFVFLLVLAVVAIRLLFG